MQLPRPGPIGVEGTAGGRKTTHDFLSLCGPPSTVHQDPPLPSPSPSLGDGSLKTRDFLGRTTGLPLPPVAGALPMPSPVEHSLPGGIGTYSISHVSYIAHRFPGLKPEMTDSRPFAVVRAGAADRADEYSSCSAGFTLWEEPSGKKGKTRKENALSAAAHLRESEMRLGRWSAADNPPQLSTNNNRRRSPFSSFSSSQRPSIPENKAFLEAMTSSKGCSNEEDELDDEETEFIVKKENSPVPRAELRVKIDGKCGEQKANTPRSKHSATEQRRRSKINDRFQMLRALIPRSDQKRDRASFLMEVIEYIQMLQEKVTKYEGSYPGWTHEPAKVMPLRNREKLGDSFIDRLNPATNGSNAQMAFASKVDESHETMMSGIPRSVREPSETDASSVTAIKSAPLHQVGTGSNVFPFPISLHSDLSAGPRDGCKGAHVSYSTAAGLGSKPRTEECLADLNDKLKVEDLAIEGGSTSFSNAYSHGLLNALTQVLQSSGVDLSQSSISVQIELGKRGSSSAATTLPFQKEKIDTATKLQRLSRTRVGGEDLERALKKPKTCEAQV